MVVLDLGSAATPAAHGSRAERIEALRASFDALADEVESQVRDLGARPVQRAWINRTLLVEAPAASVEQLAHLRGVTGAGSPRQLLADS